ncbi:MAG TPA: hypothetical protein VIA45_15955 [Thermoanaerobaculia bacterium]
MRGALAALLAAAAASRILAQTPPAEPKAAPAPAPTHAAAAKPPLDFTGVWELDEKSSRNVAKAMTGEVLTVRQTGNQIWISPMDPEKSRLLSESIVADGKTYEKALGTKGRGYLTVDWGKDGKSLWLEVTAGPDEDPRRVVQRSVWKLSKDRRVWVRQSVSIQNGKSSEATLVFRRRSSAPRSPTKKPA